MQRMSLPRMQVSIPLISGLVTDFTANRGQYKFDVSIPLISGLVTDTACSVCRCRKSVSIPLISGLVTDSGALLSPHGQSSLNPFDFRAGY
ncbi:hypothetical protein ACCAA_180043 [Candidatus Accumulibacter aalborgensis]|uniref:Uncharacterized protein n=1 Tax=Candidatus Accumulibacter aalborgensis TaxID=1860102 RepID=A0A1A8XJ88_9PROT|nr:hypothetical protein ACCAA_180043 [Candidatus Accumulibacter aalborgensis]